MYHRILLKMSGEALKGPDSYGIDPKTIQSIAKEIKEVHNLGIEVGIVCGGGNFYRGVTGEKLGMDRAQADYMGMLATIMNGLAMQNALESINVPTKLLSSLNVNNVCEPYNIRNAISHLEKGFVCIFAGGTGIPYFSTDTAAALRCTETRADALLMAKNGVKGVYDKDPRKFADANFIEHMTHNDIIVKGLKVMDQAAAAICKDNNVKIVVFNMNEPGNIIRAAKGENIGTKID